MAVMRIPDGSREGDDRHGGGRELLRRGEQRAFLPGHREERIALLREESREDSAEAAARPRDEGDFVGLGEGRHDPTRFPSSCEAVEDILYRLQRIQKGPEGGQPYRGR